MQFKHVTLDFDGSVAILRLDHQEVMNAVSVDMLGGLAEALDTSEEKKDEGRCFVLTGAGRGEGEQLRFGGCAPDVVDQVRAGI